MYHLTSFFFKFKSNFLVKRTFFLLNAALAMVILNLISRVHVASFVIMLSSYSTYSGYFLSLTICIEDGCLDIITYYYLRFFHIHFHSIASSGLN